MVESRRLHVVVKENQPVPYPRLGNHTLAAGGKCSSRQVVANPPPAPGIEASDNHMPVRPKYAVHFAKHCVRVVRRFEHMWKEYGVYRIRDYGEIFRGTNKVDSRTSLGRHDSVTFGSGTPAKQVGGSPATDLQKLIAEYIVENHSDLPGFLAQQGGTSACLKPVRAHAAILAHTRHEPYNGPVAINTAWSCPWDFLPANGYWLSE